MPVLATAHLPGISGTIAERSAEEVLAKQPAQTGDHWWLQISKDDIATSQVRAAVARAARVPEELVSDAGPRDRDCRFVQWFSVPTDAVENPGALRGAGYRSKLRVLTVTRSHKPVSPAVVGGVRWKVRIRGGNLDGGYLKARAVADHLRLGGLPNYIGAARFGRSGALARYGLMLLRGQPLPGRAEAGPGTCLRAAQDWLFNAWLSRRVADGLLATSLPGDRLRTRAGEEFLVEDPAHAQRRCDSWECSPLGPLFGAGLPPVADVAAEREAALLAAEQLDPVLVARMPGSRRPARVQPGRVVVDCDGADVLLACELPAETYLEALLSELLREAPAARGDA